jgi:hypothetical protein
MVGAVRVGLVERLADDMEIKKLEAEEFKEF